MRSKQVGLLAVVTAIMVASGVAGAAAGKPNFMPALYGDGEVWGTEFA